MRLKSAERRNDSSPNGMNDSNDNNEEKEKKGKLYENVIVFYSSIFNILNAYQRTNRLEIFESQFQQLFIKIITFVCEMKETMISNCKCSKIWLFPTLWILTMMSVITSGSSSSVGTRGTGDEPRCEEITIPMCRGIGYNLTFMPNQFNHDTQDEAGLEVHQFWPLVEIQCSNDLKFFLCSMYAPICIEDYGHPLPACRTVCERAKAGCAPLMRQYGFAWPERMNCDRLPDYGDPTQLCMDSKNGSEVAGDRGITPNPKIKGSTIEKTTGRHGYRNKGGKKPNALDPERTGGGVAGSIPDGAKEACSCDCYPPLVRVDESNAAFNKVATGGIINCGSPCYSTFFSKDERTFAKFWIGLWAVLCFASTTLTVFTFLIDPQRFRYPERPIIFLSACYLLVSVGYIVRLIAGHADVACQGSLVRYEATGSEAGACTAVFLLTHLFGMASSIWWVVLAFTWFLAAGLKWGNEAIASYSHYFHLAAWLVPSVQTIAVLATGAVDGDPVAGLCSVGNQNVANLRSHVLAPLLVYLLLGTSFLLAGFVSLFRIRNAIKAQGRAKTEKLEKLMVRIGIFSFLYTVPATVVIACLFYEQHFRELWERVHVCPCLHSSSPHSLTASSSSRVSSVFPSPSSPSPIRPDYTVFMVKYFMSLVVGITSGFWIWSGKTLDSWRRFYRRICGRTPLDAGTASYTNPPLPASRHPQPPAEGSQPRPPSKPLPSIHNIQQGSLHKQFPLSHV